MTAHQTFVARVLLSSATVIFSIAAVSSKRLRKLPRDQFERIMNLSFIVSRFALYGLVFFVLRLSPRGDIPAFYFTEAAQTMHGLMPYRDFVSSYAPLHPYMDAMVLRMWFSPLSIILLAIFAECFVLPLWFRAGRGFLSDSEIRTGAILYVTSAFSLQFVTIDGQDNVIFAALLAAATLLLYRNRALLSGTAVGAGVVALKFLPLIYVPAFFVSTRRRWRWIAGMAAIAGVVYGGFAMLRLPLLEPLATESAMRSASNLPFLVEAMTGRVFPSALWDGTLLVVMGFLFWLVASVSRYASAEVRLRALTYCTVALTVALVLLAKKSWPAYLMLVLFPMYTLVRPERRIQLTVFGPLSVVAVNEHSYWASYLDQDSSPAIHQRLMTLEIRCLVFVVLEVLLMIFLGWLLAASTREILLLRRPVSPANLAALSKQKNAMA